MYFEMEVVLFEMQVMLFVNRLLAFCRGTGAFLSGNGPKVPKNRGSPHGLPLWRCKDNIFFARKQEVLKCDRLPFAGRGIGGGRGFSAAPLAVAAMIVFGVIFGVGGALAGGGEAA